MSKEISVNDMVLAVSSTLGDTVSSATIELVIRTYQNLKRGELLKGNSVREDGIGTLRPSWRKVSSAFNPKVPFTAKMVTDLDTQLKQDMIVKLCQDADFRRNVGAEEL